MKPNNVFAGEHIGLPRTAVGIAPRGFVFQPEHVDVKVLIAIQIAHGNGDVIECLNPVFDFCHRPPRKQILTPNLQKSDMPRQPNLDGYAGVFIDRGGTGGN